MEMPKLVSEPSHGGVVWLFVNFSANNLGGREIESRSQPFAERTTLMLEGKKFGNEKTTNRRHARERPATREHARKFEVSVDSIPSF